MFEAKHVMNDETFNAFLSHCEHLEEAAGQEAHKLLQHQVNQSKFISKNKILKK